MNDYLYVLKMAIIFFPFIAFIISIPFILRQYHKYGSVSFMKSLIIYSFVLYFICAYFLIILPLPHIDDVVQLTTPRTQLIPFSFAMDFIKESSFNILEPATYLKALTQSCFYVVIYNVFLTIPFGIYLKYYFNYSLKKVIIFSFLLSLFFELTQLSGLYFIYPRGYRLFDIDDLFLNTLGGIIGYFASSIFINILPTKEEINKSALEKGKKISMFKKTTSICLDLFIFLFSFGILDSILHFTLKQNISFIIGIIIYYVVIPYLLRGSTIGEKFLNLRIVDYKDKNNIFKLFLRRFLFVLFYIIIPILLFYLGIAIYHIDSFDKIIKTILISVLGLSILLIYFIAFIKYMFPKKPMLYEKISKTKLISTIK